MPFKPYDAASCYRLTAISKATGILRSYRKALRGNPNAKKPYADKLMLTDCYAFKIQDKRLRLTLRAHEYAYIDLNPHTLAVISGHTVRSITSTACTIVLAFLKEIDAMELDGSMGIDRNLDNLTLATSGGQTVKYDLSRATEIKEKCRQRKRNFKRNDIRIRRKVFSKYGIIQTNRVQWILHNVSASIVRQAKERRLGIIMEDIKGIRKLYHKGNGQGTDYRARLNSWSYYELQRQIEYKAKWEGIPVIFVSARGTSANCSICGSRTYPNGQRTLFCPKCGISIDRDVNAARNILAKGGLRFSPDGGANEAMKGNGTMTPILKANAPKLTRREDYVPTS